jgi:glyceraldehyde-3-phosphate dehydrogenase (NAD(P))
MTLKVAINGFGRIGRNFMRCWLSRGTNTGIELVGINGSGDTNTNAHLLKYDSMLGPLRNTEVTTTEDTIVVNGKTIKTFYDRNPANLPWKEWGVDLVIESTGVFNDDVGASKHFEAGAKKVILTAPGKGAKGGHLRGGRQRRPVPPRRLGHPQQRQLHHQLHGAGRQGAGSGLWHRQGHDDHHPQLYR